MICRVQRIAWLIAPGLLLLGACALGAVPEPTDLVGHDLKRAQDCVEISLRESQQSPDAQAILKGALAGIQELKRSFPADKATAACEKDEPTTEQMAAKVLSWAGNGIRKQKPPHVKADVLLVQIESLRSILGKPLSSPTPRDGGTAKVRNTQSTSPHGQGEDLKPLQQQLGIIQACLETSGNTGDGPAMSAAQQEQITKATADLQSVNNDLQLAGLDGDAVCTGRAVGTAALTEAKKAAENAQEVLQHLQKSDVPTGPTSQTLPKFDTARIDINKVRNDLTGFPTQLPGGTKPQEGLVQFSFPVTVVLETLTLLLLVWALASRGKQQKHDQRQAEFAVQSSIAAATTAAETTLEAANLALQQAKAAQKSMAMLREEQELHSSYAAALQEEPRYALPSESIQAGARAEFVQSAEPSTPPPVADHNELTGNTVEDYNRYRRVATHDAEERFLARYRSSLVQLTCDNLHMYRDENAELLLRKDSNGNFMAVMEADGSLSVLPMVGMNPSDSRALFAGIFGFPSSQGAVRLAKAARALPRGGDGNFVVRSTERGSFESA